MQNSIIKELEEFAEPKFREWLKPFINFKDYPNEILLGVRVPYLRNLAKKYRGIDEKTLLFLLQNNCHEYRALALFIMVLKAKKEPQKMCKLYLSNLNWINNWDLIDYTAPHIVAPNVGENVLRELANSDYLWANRVAMVSTIYFIRQNNFDLALEFAEKFIHHKHHLMHKAAGWMLREVGKKDENILRKFLEKHSSKMPAVMRSYAKERLK